MADAARLLRDGAARPDLWQGATDSHLLDQLVLPRPGRCALRLLRARPRAGAPRDGHPVLYLLDGMALPPLLRPLLAAQPGLMLVCVGHDTGRAFSTADRFLDYVPPLAPERASPGTVVGPVGGTVGGAVGGAAAFAALLTGPVRALAEQGLPVDPARRALWGHSLGGLLVLDLLFRSPAAFRTHVAASPSLWWAEPEMRAAAAAARPAAGARLLVTLGDRESRSDAPPLTVPQPAPATLAMIADLARRPDLDLRHIVFPGAQHGPAMALSLPPALEAGAMP